MKYSFRHIFLIFLLPFFFTTAAFAQKQRFLQEVDLTQKENQAYFSYSYSLPALIMQGIETGNIKPYKIDYESNTITPLSLEQYHQSLILILDDGFSSDTLRLLPNDLSRLQFDVTKENGAFRRLNYIHFRSLDPFTLLLKYHFSVSFEEVAAYLYTKNAVWVRNENLLLWKNQILHTYGNNPIEVIPQEFVPGAAGMSFVHLVKNKKGNFEKFHIYNRKHELINEISLQDSAFRKLTPDIKWLPDALAAGLYHVGVGKDMFKPETLEENIKTTVLENKPIMAAKNLPTQFSIIQTDRIYLERPENQKFYREGQELFTVINRLVQNGKLETIYKNDSLTVRMPTAEWETNLKERITMEPNDQGVTLIAERTYNSRDVAVMSLSWKIYFNLKGEIIAKVPHVIGFYLNANITSYGLEFPIGYLKFDDLVPVLNKLPAAKLLKELRKQHYFGYWTDSSGIALEQTR